MRAQRFGLMLSRLERQALEQLAEAEGGLSQAALLRRLVRREARERGLWPALEDEARRCVGDEHAKGVKQDAA